MNLIECTNLTKRIMGRRALDQLSVIIQQDKITGLIGRNGAGKTTLMKVLAGYWKETSGTVRVLGERPFNNLFVSTNSIYVDDLMTFSHNLTLEDVLQEAERAYPNWNSTLSKRLFEYFSFQPKEKHSVLSKGQRSTFNVIVGLASRCKITMFDEPTTGMDASVRKDFYRVLLKDFLAYPRSIIVSSHHLEEIEDVLEDIILIDDGKVFLQEAIDDLKEYAKGIYGRMEILYPLIEEVDKEEVIYHTQHGENNMYAVVKSESVVVEKARQSDMDIGPVTPNDLCIYLTAKEKGGIDDVYN